MYVGFACRSQCRRLQGTTNGSLQFAVQTEGKYPYLWDKAASNWSTSKNVRNIFVMGSGGVDAEITLFHNEFMTAADTTPASVPGMGSRMKDTIGPELGIGFTLGNYTNDPVMTLKTCIGDRALGWDLLPPGVKGYNYTGGDNKTWTYAGYHQSPEKWPAGTTPVPMGWAAGIQYDGDTQRAYDVRLARTPLSVLVCLCMFVWVFAATLHTLCGVSPPVCTLCEALLSVSMKIVFANLFFFCCGAFVLH